MVGSCFQAKIHAPSYRKALTKSWSGPVYFCELTSHSVMMSVGQGNYYTLGSRIANELGIREGDKVKVEIEELNLTCKLKIHVQEGIKPDFIINGASGYGEQVMMIQGFSCRPNGTHYITLSGDTIRVPEQSLFAGMAIIPPKIGSIKLYFDGGCRNNPHGPAGCGFLIISGAKELVKGYAYKEGEHTSNSMEYRGLIEGLIWADRLRAKTITIKGDSELIIKQVEGNYRVQNPTLENLCNEAQKLILKIRDPQSTKETFQSQVCFEHISRSENQAADALANKGMDRKENKVVVNWNNVNNFTRPQQEMTRNVKRKRQER